MSAPACALTPHDSTVACDAALLQATAKAKAAYPQETARIERGLAIAVVGGVTLLPDGTALVQSQTQAGVQYQVNGHCTCTDAAYAPESRCKHRWGKSLVKWALRAIEEVPVIRCPICCIADCDGCVILEEPETVPQTPPIAPEHLVEIQGKRFVKFAGLLALAHQRGLLELTEKWTYNDAGLSLAEAMATFKDGGQYRGAGDATPENVSKMVKPHFRRIALTRAKARALRDALNIGECSVEELAE